VVRASNKKKIHLYEGESISKSQSSVGWQENVVGGF
jgi:hypothetical protein